MNSILLISAIIVLTLLPCYLLRQVKLTKQTLAQSELARSQLEKMITFEELNNAPYTPKMRVMIEIHDPLELAKREQPLTKYLSQLAPELIIKKVYEQVAAEIEEGLKEKQVNAAITIDKY
ncbi:hypothetical protein [Alkalimarinus sediminis]|uniref:Uncharacterized protein n=1 Tax=Alkalimarinus sediminis TaxID=1632866 RepID=A0A9E8KQ84_9ALTE|nr:hypothetical protein [Alkalimarinus sediminis]UZW75529.1 hypothetical protein NNL22_02725 [Alkalimarinus sediminis]